MSERIIVLSRKDGWKVFSNFTGVMPDGTAFTLAPGYKNLIRSAQVGEYFHLSASDGSVWPDTRTPRTGLVCVARHPDAVPAPEVGPAPEATPAVVYDQSKFGSPVSALSSLPDVVPPEVLKRRRDRAALAGRYPWRGFTLIELMVVVAIVALIGAVVWGLANSNGCHIEMR